MEALEAEGEGRLTVAADLVDVLAAAIEQAAPEQRGRLRAALGVEPPADTGGERTPAAYTVRSLAEQLGRSERSVRAAIARGELAAVKRGRGWIVSADAVERWAKPSPRPAASPPRPPRRAGRGPMSRALNR